MALTKRTPVVTIPLTLALRFHLMSGAPAPFRVDGWVAMAQGGDDAAALRAAWEQYAAALTAEAHRAGFEPWGLTRRRPTSAAFRAWAVAFVKQHGPKV